jgi:hypothetical protein
MDGWIDEWMDGWMDGFGFGFLLFPTNLTCYNFRTTLSQQLSLFTKRILSFGGGLCTTTIYLCKP